MNNLTLTILSWSQRAISIGGALLLMRLVSKCHGDEGVVFVGVTSAISGWIGMFDLGSFNVSSQLVSRHFRSGRWRSLTAFFSLGIGVLAMFIMVIAVLLWVFLGPGWPAVLLRRADSSWLTLFFVASAIGVGGALGWRWRLAQGNPHRVIVSQIVAQVIGVCTAVIYLTSHGDRADLGISALLAIVPQLFVQQGYLWSAVGEQGSKFLGVFKGIDSRVRGILMRRHAKSALLSVVCMIIHQSDVLVVAAMADQGAALAGYILASKVFFSFVPLVTASLQSHAPALTRLWSDRDVSGMRMVVIQVLVANVVAASIFTLCMATQRTWIFPLLAPGSTVIPSVTLLILFGVYIVLRVWTDLWAQILLGASDFWSNIAIAGVQAVLTMFFMILLVPSCGGNGAILALIVGFLCTASWFLPWRVARQLGRLPF